MRSYIRSTGSYRQSGGQDVPCSVHISVMRRAAPARPGPDVQRDLRRQGSACGTHPAAGEPAVDDDEVTPVPGALVLQHGAQFRPRSVGDGARERAVLQHIADGQVLDHDRLVLADESSGELVEKVVPAIGDPCMDPGHLASALVVIAGTSGLAGELSLGPREAGSVPALVSGIGDLLSRGEGDEEVIPMSTPTERSVSGPGAIASSHSMDTNHRPARSRDTVTVVGSAPAGRGGTSECQVVSSSWPASDDLCAT